MQTLEDAYAALDQVETTLDKLGQELAYEHQRLGEAVEHHAQEEGATLLWKGRPEAPGKKREERAGFRAKSEQFARRVSSTTIGRLRNRSTGYLQRSVIVNSDGKSRRFWGWARPRKQARLVRTKQIESAKNWSEGSTEILNRGRSFDPSEYSEEFHGQGQEK